MRKTCVFITRTNGVGKSSIARAFIERYGGVDRITNDVSYLRDGNISLAGRYNVRYGGVDRITNEKGSSSTALLAGVVEEALRNSDVVLCEGSFMNTMGLNMTNAMFKAERHLLVSLYAQPLVLYKRITERSNGKNNKGTRVWGKILKKQRQAMLSARRWQEIGVRVIQFDTGECSIDYVCDRIIETIEEINK